MAEHYDRSVRSKEEWLDDVTLEPTEHDIPKEEPSCDVTLKIFDEPYIPPVYSKVGRTGGVPQVLEEVKACMTDDISRMEADEYRHQYVSADTYGVERSYLEQIGVAGRSKEVKVEPSKGDDGEGGENDRVDASIEEVCRYSEVARMECEYGGDGDGSDNLVGHYVGNEARPFACNMCNYNSSSAYHLKRHVMGHSGEKPFACSYCDYKSHRADKVKRHARTHTGEKPFGCTYCNYKASRADHLKAHVRSHVMRGLGKNFSRLLDSS